MQYNKTSISIGYNLILSLIFSSSSREKTQVNLQKDIYSKAKLKKGCGPMQNAVVWKKFWNTGGGQEMAVMVGQWQNF